MKRWLGKRCSRGERTSLTRGESNAISGAFKNHHYEFCSSSFCWINSQQKARGFSKPSCAKRWNCPLSPPLPPSPLVLTLAWVPGRQAGKVSRWNSFCLLCVKSGGIFFFNTKTFVFFVFIFYWRATHIKCCVITLSYPCEKNVCDRASG